MIGFGAEGLDMLSVFEYARKVCKKIFVGKELLPKVAIEEAMQKDASFKKEKCGENKNQCFHFKVFEEKEKAVAFEEVEF